MTDQKEIMLLYLWVVQVQLPHRPRIKRGKGGFVPPQEPFTFGASRAGVRRGRRRAAAQYPLNLSAMIADIVEQGEFQASANAHSHVPDIQPRR
jgi:hypothetical protein